MIIRFAKRAFQSRSERALGRYLDISQTIIRQEAEHRSLSANSLRSRAQTLRNFVRDGVDLDRILVPAFALVREASRRALGELHTPAQLVAGLAMNDGYIAEMPTGEGKTLAATLTAALRAMTGRGVHVASPNDYLSARDAAWMRPVYETLGSSVGLITSPMDDDSRRAAYARDVTYGVASEFGFDYLRDNMKYSRLDSVQRGRSFALVDEADAVLIDEAAMPLALFGPLGDHSEFYRTIDAHVARLGETHFRLDGRRVSLTDDGYDRIEEWLKQAGLLKSNLSLHVPQSISLLHHVVQALYARTILVRDRDYVVKNGSVVIVDTLTGRLMDGRRYDDGLHQALEAKENCEIGEETRTLASVTFQSFFRKYDKLAGMTGTAIEDADEYSEVYGLAVLPIPSHRPLHRTDERVEHATRADKLAAVVEQIELAYSRKQPVLVGAPTIIHSERVASELQARGWKAALEPGERHFAILNARHHEDEARIIAQAGAPGAVTVATAMAGRGTDIKLGGFPDDALQRQRVIAAGGLMVIGTEPHETDRLDRQLLGRAGRQGDPGRTVVHLSWDDDILEQDARMADVPSPQPRLNLAIAAVQQRNRSRKFNQRRALMRFDDIVEQQRATVLAQREIARDTPDPLEMVKDLRDDTINDLLEECVGERASPDIARLDLQVRAILTLAIEFPPSIRGTAELAGLHHRIVSTADDWMAGKAAAFGEEQLASVLRTLMIALLDQLWCEQTERLDHLRRRISDRRLSAQLVHAEFGAEAFEMLASSLREFRHEVTAHTMRIGRRPTDTSPDDVR
jgi:preprotein translocase subunit SecA